MACTVVATTPVNFYRVKPSFEVPLVYQNYYPDTIQSRDPILLQIGAATLCDM